MRSYGGSVTCFAAGTYRPGASRPMATGTVARSLRRRRKCHTRATGRHLFPTPRWRAISAQGARRRDAPSRDCVPNFVVRPLPRAACPCRAFRASSIHACRAGPAVCRSARRMAAVVRNAQGACRQRSSERDRLSRTTRGTIPRRKRTGAAQHQRCIEREELPSHDRRRGQPVRREIPDRHVARPLLVRYGGDHGQHEVMRAVIECDR